MKFFDALGHGLAKTAKVAAKGAVYMSKNPEVLAEVATIAGHPEIVGVVAGIDTVAKAVRKAHMEQAARSMPVGGVPVTVTAVQMDAATVAIPPAVEP